MEENFCAKIFHLNKLKNSSTEIPNTKRKIIEQIDCKEEEKKGCCPLLSVLTYRGI